MSERDDILRAIALQYDGENAPIVTASGEGAIAEEILRIAREHNIPLREDALLAELLSDLSLGEEIPPMLYRVIAEVIAYAYLVSGKVPVNKKENSER
ncbi:EscU/YscU/HrcU family type III secretion system export apparatus switch protein [Methylophaga sp. OBS1]|jgi:flagellar biosynthesis protein|uniref:EscU/YscU/HrcU family type III secretion system export apparatus switch protein n=1 Tax=Methylophaga sp. OBS1 TaxID=2991933 RepID=UPI002257133F|nr:EscU/YscU/HrcU family type III secretion system export apparatus switch protein [Methylophaga sp. OBS1]MCX4192965.1 EscU/YscU/HrcU family type III secretion system export apparatus switch protein [Methylophaga sp. OBS1]